MNLFETAIPESAQLGLPTTQSNKAEDLSLIHKLLKTYDQGTLAAKLKEIDSPHCRVTINRWVKGKATLGLTLVEYMYLQSLLPPKSAKKPHSPSLIYVQVLGELGKSLKPLVANVYSPQNVTSVPSVPTRQTTTATQNVTTSIRIYGPLPCPVRQIGREGRRGLPKYRSRNSGS